MDKLNNELEIINASEQLSQARPAGPAALKDFVEPEISEPVDILKATAMFLQITGTGDV